MGQFVAEIPVRESMADRLSQQVSLIQQQQKESLSQRIEQQERNNAFQYKQLEKVYGFKLDGWNPQYIAEFGKLQSHVSEKLAGAKYTNIQEFLADVSKLSGIHSGLDTHFQQRKPALVQASKIVSNPGLWQDKTVRVLDTPEDLSRKDNYYFGIGTMNPRADVNSMSIVGRFVGMDGTEIKDQEGNVVSGDVLMHPHIGDTSVYMPALEKRGDISPEEFAQLYSRTVDGLIEEGVTGNKLIERIRTGMTQKLQLDQTDGDGMFIQSANNIFDSSGLQAMPATETDPAIAPIPYYVDEALRYIQTKAKVTTTTTRRDPSQQQLNLNNLLRNIEQRTIPGAPLELVKSFTDDPLRENKIQAEGILPLLAESITETIYNVPEMVTGLSGTEGIDVSKYVDSKVSSQGYIGGIVKSTKPVYVRPATIIYRSNGDVVLKNSISSNSDVVLPEEIVIPASDTDKIRNIDNAFLSIYGVKMSQVQSSLGTQSQKKELFD